MSDFTQRLTRAAEVDGNLSEEILTLVYAELRKRAAALMASERRDHTLQPTALVHEAWLRLVDRSAHTWKNRAHFFACAAEAMRWVLVDHARRKRTLRRGGDLIRLEWEEASDSLAIENPHEFLALNAALQRLETVHPGKAELVKLRFFAGVTLDEAAHFLGISVPTAKRHWAFARAWLFKETRKDV